MVVHAHYLCHADAFVFEDSVESIINDVDLVMILFNSKPWCDFEPNAPTYKTDTSEVLKMLDHLKEQYPDKVKIYHKELPEMVSREFLVAESRKMGADFGLVIDTDEIYMPGALEKDVNIMEEKNLTGIWTLEYCIYKRANWHRVGDTLLGNLRLINLRSNSGYRGVRNWPYCRYPHHSVIHFSFLRENDEKILEKVRTFSHCHEVRPEWYQDEFLMSGFDSEVKCQILPAKKQVILKMEDLYQTLYQDKALQSMKNVWRIAKFDTSLYPKKLLQKLKNLGLLEGDKNE